MWRSCPVLNTRAFQGALGHPGCYPVTPPNRGQCSKPANKSTLRPWACAQHQPCHKEGTCTTEPVIVCPVVTTLLGPAFSTLTVILAGEPHKSSNIAKPSLSCTLTWGFLCLHVFSEVVLIKLQKNGCWLQPSDLQSDQASGTCSPLTSSCSQSHREKTKHSHYY